VYLKKDRLKCFREIKDRYLFTWPLKESMRNCSFVGCTHSMHFWTTWLPFWSLTHFSSFPCNSLTMSSCWSSGIHSRAFWMTRQPYICSARCSTFERSCKKRERTGLWDWGCLWVPPLTNPSFLSSTASYLCFPFGDLFLAPPQKGKTLSSFTSIWRLQSLLSCWVL